MEGDPDEQELQAALLMSLQPAPEARRSKLRDGEAPETLDADARARGAERELRAAAAEQRMRAFVRNQEKVATTRPAPSIVALGDPLSLDDSEKLFSMVFGSSVSNEIIAQWCHQGFRFSSDSETSLGLVQREGGPCGVLAPVQAMVLKYLLFENREVLEMPSNPHASASSPIHNNDLSKWPDCALIFSDLQRTRALLLAFADILWLVGGGRKAVVAVLDVGMLTSGGELNNRMKNVATMTSGGDGRAEQQDEMISEKLEGISLNSAMDLHQNLRICTFTTASSLLHQLSDSLPVFRSRVGALLFLFSALLSRGLEAIQSDRDDPGQPLVTAPFGHASQAIHQIEKSKGGLKNTDAAGGSKQFDLYHFNGIAKTVGNSSSVQQRPRLTKLKVSVPPKWTREEYMMDYKPSTSDQGSDAASSMDSNAKKPKEEPAQHAPIVDCIRTRWERASCNWAGDSPSIV